MLPIADRQAKESPPPDLVVSKLLPYSEEGWKSFVNKPEYAVSQDVVNGIFKIMASKVGQEAIDEGVQIKTRDIYSLTIPTRNPANTSTRANSDYTILMQDAEIEVLTQTVTLGNPSTYHLIVEVEVRVNGKLHFIKSWNTSVPRHLN